MTIAGGNLARRAAVRLAVGSALLLAALSVARAIHADQAAAAYYPTCWTRGHYITAYQLNSWNNTIGHRVVCDQNVDVTGQLWRYNRNTGGWTMPREYSWNGTSYTNGSWINAVNPAVYAPLYCGSTYMLRLYVRSVATGARTMYDGPNRSWC
jgi:hypothetical protein